MNIVCDLPKASPGDFPNPDQDIAATGEQSIVLGGGCFWCTEAVYRQLRGVKSVISGYAGGTAATANYDRVCSGNTDHAEVIEIRYDAAQVTLGKLLKIFFSVAHDPTQLNRQGNDRGRQYRSAIFYADKTQKIIAEAYIAQLNAAKVYSDPIVTTLEPLVKFFPAEACHQNYAALNPNQGYIAMVSTPKVEKLRQYFSETLR